MVHGKVQQGLTSHSTYHSHFGHNLLSQTTGWCKNGVQRKLNCTQVATQKSKANAVVTWEIRLFQNYFSLHRHLSAIIIFHHVETCLKLFQNHFTSLLQLMNIFQHVQCHWKNCEIISELFQWQKYFYFSFRLGYMWNKIILKWL